MASPHVHVKVRVDFETLSSCLASEGPLAGVHPDVPDQVNAVKKLLPARLAKVGILPRVHPPVPPPHVLQVKWPSPECSLWCRMRLLMSAELCHRFGRGAACPPCASGGGAAGCCCW